MFSFPTAVPPVILRLAEPEQRLDTCIEFTVRGYPHPKLRWFHKEKEIQQNDYIRTDMDSYQDYLEGCLTFQNPTHINNGNYTLEASNPLGTVTKTVYGHFLMPPDENGEWTSPFVFLPGEIAFIRGFISMSLNKRRNAAKQFWFPQAFDQLSFLFLLPILVLAGSQ